MQLNLSILTNAEFKSRKFWRKCFFIFYGLIIFVALIGSVISLSFSAITPGQLGAATAEGIIFIAVPAFIFYHFAYKKAGTYLLTLYLYLKPIDVLIKGVIISTLPFPYNVSLLAAMFLITVFFYRLNWKLRRINKKLQLHAIYPEEYILETGPFSNAASRDDLDTLYTSLIRQWPQFEKYSTYLYQQRLPNLKS